MNLYQFKWIGLSVADVIIVIMGTVLIAVYWNEIDDDFNLSLSLFQRNPKIMLGMFFVLKGVWDLMLDMFLMQYYYFHGR